MSTVTWSVNILRVSIYQTCADYFDSRIIVLNLETGKKNSNEI